MERLIGKHWHHLREEEVLELLGADRDKGLDILEVETRQARFGRNALPRKRRKTKLERFLAQFHQPLVYILLVAGVVTAALGEPVDSAVIVAVVLVNAVIGYVQEAKAIAALDALAMAMRTDAAVLRAGVVRRIPAEDLVPGDMVLLRSGDKVPADLRLVTVKDLRVDEAALTGESLPVDKAPGVLDSEAVLADRRNMAYASTLVAYGQGMGVVTAIGQGTEIGAIAKLTSEVEQLATPLTRKITQFSHVVLLAILVLAGLTFLAGLAHGETAGEMFMAAVALAVGAIPEGLPAAVTVILAMGVSRMAKRRAIIRRLQAVETLGSTTVICSDKTGTLTENQMTVTTIWAGGQEHRVEGVGYIPSGHVLSEGGEEPNPAVLECLRAGLLCNDSKVLERDGRWTVEGDPTEAALLVAAAKAGLDRAKEEAGRPRLDTLPFESEHQYMATLHPQENGTIAYIKGAAEVLLARCVGAMGPDGTYMDINLAEAQERVEAMASGGLRVLALASKRLPPGMNTLGHGDVAEGLILLGLQGMIDPPRAEAVASVAACLRAGVRVKMITGDHAVTARAIGTQIGLRGPKCDSHATCQVITGADLARIGDEELVTRVDEVEVFARVSPDQKLRLVMALQSSGNVVAMTGDGVNDAPALKQADIGVAMGLAGTEAAKEAADMVLTDDNFASIEAAVEEGRGVFDNLLKFIVWTLPTNVGEGLVIIAAVLLGVALPIEPVQILWINMTTAGCLGLMLAFEPKEPGLMDRLPRESNQPILDRYLTWRIIMVGGLMLMSAFGIFYWELSEGSEIAVARTSAVNVFVIVEAFYLFNCRSLSRSPWDLGFWSNPWVPFGVGLMVALQIGFTYLPFMHGLFGSAPVGFLSWFKAIGAGLVAFVLVELGKRFSAGGTVVSPP